jgi:tRNA A37 threonylcarbamoyladenosine dehydratase
VHTLCFPPHTLPTCARSKTHLVNPAEGSLGESLEIPSEYAIESNRMDSYNARFGGIRRLYSASGLERLRAAHVCVVGLGGVGSWAVEALARSGVGHLTLVDLDDVCISNVSRQLHALSGNLGKPKVEVMERRVNAINPDCVVHALHSFFLKSTVSEIFRRHYDFVVDAIDDSDMKCLLIATCRDRGIPIITSGASAGRRDPCAIEVTDLAFSSHDRLLQGVRKRLRKEHGFPTGEGAFGVEAVISRESVVYARKDGTVCTRKEEGMDLRLDCHTGYGAASFVTGAFGLVAASRVVHRLSGTATPPPVRVSQPADCDRHEAPERKPN